MQAWKYQSLALQNTEAYFLYSLWRIAWRHRKEFISRRSQALVPRGRSISQRSSRIFLEGKIISSKANYQVSILFLNKFSTGRVYVEKLVMNMFRKRLDESFSMPMTTSLSLILNRNFRTTGFQIGRSVCPENVSTWVKCETTLGLKQN